MGMLTGKEIIRQVELGNIKIDPFDENRINPNSYNMRLGDTLKIYHPRDGAHLELDSHKDNPTIDLIIPKEGIVLQPNILYLGRTIETFNTDIFVPKIDGRSSIGRLGVVIHLTAGFGDIGFNGSWTLEITVVHPIRIYAGDEICQMAFETPIGDISYKYAGRYQGQIEATASRFSQKKKGAYKSDV